MLERRPAAAGPLAFTLAASPASPLENVTLVVRGWGEAGATLALDGKAVPRGPGFRFGHRRTLEGAALVVFVTARSEALVRLVLAPR